MRLKIIILLFSIILLCGCEVVYNLDMDDNFNETIIIIPENENESNKFKSSLDSSKMYTAHLLDSYDPEEGYPADIDYYDVLLGTDNSLNFNYKFKDGYKDTRAGYRCFPSFRYIVGKNLRINTLADFTCFDEYPTLSKVTINIKTSGKVQNHNADSVSNNVYTWTIKRDEYRAINIEVENPNYDGSNSTLDNIVPNNTDEDDNKKDEQNNSSNKTSKETKKTNDKSNIILIAILSGLFFIVLFGIIFFRNKINNM